MPERRAIDRSQVVAEAYPGAANDIEAQVDALGGWCCEAHPWMPFPHGSCAGPGMPQDEARVRADGWPLCPVCGEDELWSSEVPASVESIVGCYRCGPL